jgi:hypothetical protein
LREQERALYASLISTHIPSKVLTRNNQTKVLPNTFVSITRVMRKAGFREDATPVQMEVMGQYHCPIAPLILFWLNGDGFMSAVALCRPVSSACGNSLHNMNCTPADRNCRIE